MASSPHSTDENTNHGTPSTNLTAFTPEADFGSKGRVPGFVHPVSKLRPAKPKHASVCDDSQEDVFLTAPVAAKGPQLSPTAEVFTPRLSAGFMNNGGPAQVGYIDRAHDNIGTRLPAKFAYFPVNVPGAPRSAQVPAVDPNALRYGFGLLTLDQTPHKPVAGIYLHDFNITEGVFTMNEKSISRSFAVTGVPLSFGSKIISRHFPPELFPSIRGINSTDFEPSGLFSLSCDDIRDAKRAADVAHAILPYSYIFPLTAKMYASDNGRDPDLVTDHEGEIIINIYYHGHATAPPVEAAPVLAEIKRLLAQCGDVKAFHTSPATQTHLREIRVEFYNASLVHVARDVIRGTIIHGAVLDVIALQPDVRVVSEFDEEHHEQLSVTGRSRVPFDPDYDRIAFAIQRDGLRNGRRLNQAMNHNAVDISRIQAGLDVRTTIMLRNIPNRVDQAMLKNLLDVTSRGRYDFMYLRIDFANNCNVGYAFINFVDFVLARAGKRWNCFASDKIAEVSYATIQGKDCLVQKFRNSSVMLEHPAFRPKLFVAGNVPNAGQEEKFPEPDNHSKMRRSVENAEHVGLYLPHFRPGWFRERFAAGDRFRRRQPLRRPGKFNVDGARRRGVYLPPARATKSEVKGPQDFAANPSPPRRSPPRRSPPRHSPPHRRMPFVIDTRSPYDPFAGCPRAFPQGQVYREEQRRRRSQFDRGTPGAENELGVAPRYRLQDPALEHIGNLHLPRY
ncbi:uncharacterized protein Z519_02462 [Cladophialophora bantiana CBS 173.52]|uniref:Mei2-like C-terminal RNA recognition motif domain-containing protein n=1 Tax=Cladophialophora bantiana (strain ATCC 10958 / CBS 173.52 / CDC B-1940 / NIH 8579) TaxID=1442370 RepID=A0A0D2I1N6_CLAB1|nr:uncharacterized protein Z519_02462 [Cladophialophora bantiana CBS 173.52]KIW97070.1 hypothetical protein Z519_02462 [Cladophialophora bantiana CBS 173.52]